MALLQPESASMSVASVTIEICADIWNYVSTPEAMLVLKGHCATRV